MFRLTAMSSRRALLTGGLASLLPFTVRAQSPSRTRELPGPLIARHRVPGFLGARFDACGPEPFGTAN